MALTLVRKIRRNRGFAAICRCSCGRVVILSLSEFQSKHKQTCGSKKCTSKVLSALRLGKPRPDLVGRIPNNKLDRTGKRYGKLVAIKDVGDGRWLCQCDCGFTVSALSTNLASAAKMNRGCLRCGNLKDITGEKVGLLTAVSFELPPIGEPLWTFLCNCGNTIQGTVREFHAQFLRSCGCLDNTHSSWKSMLGRCYNPSNNRYKHYGGRGIRVCKRWFEFSNFLEDMGERPKRHTLSRKNCEKGYYPSNCIWEHISKNIADTNFGKPTQCGLRKGQNQGSKSHLAYVGITRAIEELIWVS